MSVFQIKKCPVCRARMQGDEPLQQVCHRCQADLVHVRTTCLYAQHWQNQARTALQQQQVYFAVFAAKKAVSYLNNPSTQQTLVAALFAAHQLETS